MVLSLFRISCALLVFANLICACSTENQKTTEETVEEPSVSEINDHNSQTENIQPVLKPDSLYSYQLINDPFNAGTIGESTLEDYISSINGSFSISKQPVQNRHVPDRTDTIVTISAGNSEIALYQADGPKFMLLNASVNDPEILLRDGFRVGMNRSELLSKLNQHNHKWAVSSNKVVVADEMGLQTLEFFVSDKKVTGIKFEGYVD